MTISPDLLQAKQVLSSRLLRAGLQGNAIAGKHSIRVHDVIASAGTYVHAVGVGRKIVNGVATDTPSVRIYVKQKISPSLLSPRDVLPEIINGIATDIIETPPAFFMARKGPKKAASVAIL